MHIFWKAAEIGVSAPNRAGVPLWRDPVSATEIWKFFDLRPYMNATGSETSYFPFWLDRGICDLLHVEMAQFFSPRNAMFEIILMKKWCLQFKTLKTVVLSSMISYILSNEDSEWIFLVFICDQIRDWNGSSETYLHRSWYHSSTIPELCMCVELLTISK